MIAEAERTVSEAREAHPAVLDAALIAVAQRAEHYKIAVYRAWCTYTQILVGSEAAEMLQLTLNEEVEADLKLTRLAETAVNLDAAEAGQEVQKNAEDGGAEQPWGSPMK
jgi:ferritin-like metal-binding protein YciE